VTPAYASPDGSFQRQDSTFRDTPDEVVAGRYHLYADPINGFETLREAYLATDPDYDPRGIFALLDALDERLGSSRLLFGHEPLEADWRLFTTLVRFDRLALYPNLRYGVGPDDGRGSCLRRNSSGKSRLEGSGLAVF
jgi:glutathionyl-hydroquinone reductase